MHEREDDEATLIREAAWLTAAFCVVGIRKFGRFLRDALSDPRAPRLEETLERLQVHPPFRLAYRAHESYVVRFVERSKACAVESSWARRPRIQMGKPPLKLAGEFLIGFSQKHLGGLQCGGHAEMVPQLLDLLQLWALDLRCQTWVLTRPQTKPRRWR